MSAHGSLSPEWMNMEPCWRLPHGELQFPHMRTIPSGRSHRLELWKEKGFMSLTVFLDAYPTPRHLYKIRLRSRLFPALSSC